MDRLTGLVDRFLQTRQVPECRVRRSNDGSKDGWNGLQNIFQSATGDEHKDRHDELGELAAGTKDRAIATSERHYSIVQAM